MPQLQDVLLTIQFGAALFVPVEVVYNTEVLHVSLQQLQIVQDVELLPTYNVLHVL